MDTILRKIASNQIIRLLSNRPYLYFSLSVFFSQVAFNMLNIVLIFLIFHLTSSNFSVAILIFVLLIPQILISFLGGVIADTGDKKKILIVGNILRAIVLVILFINFNSIGLVYFVTLVVSVITQFYVPAESPMIPSLVEKEELVAANSIFGISFFGSILIGYVIAGPVITVLGRGNIFLVLSALFVLAAVFAAMIPSTKVKAATTKISFQLIRGTIRGELRESFKVLSETKVIKDAFFLLIFSQIIVFILATLIPGYAKTILQVPAEDLSVILFAPAAIGMIVSAVLMVTVFSKISKERLMSGGVFISGLVLLLLPATSRIVSQQIVQSINLIVPDLFSFNVFNFVLLLAFFAGFANALIFIPSQTVIQEAVPENFRSKIYGLLFSLIGVFSLLPIMIAGGVADIFGVGAVLVFIGASIILIGLMREELAVSIARAILKHR